MDHNIIIVGAGPVGLCLARSLAETGLNILIVEKQDEKALHAPAYDGREIALTHHSYGILEKLGLWGRIPVTDKGIIRDAKVQNGDSPYALHFDHRESGHDHLGFIVSNHAIRKAAYDSIQKFKNIRLMTGAEVTDAGTDGFRGWIKLASGETLEAKLLVAADSRFSPVRDFMGIRTDVLDFKRICIVCRLSHEKPHDETAYECFHYDRTLAVLPLHDKCSSIVITLPAEESKAVLEMDAAGFAADIAERIDRRLGKMKLAGKLFPYPLTATWAQRFCAPRFALIGDAAVGMHPVTAHGFNFGLSGQDILAREIVNALETGSDIGGIHHLRRYETEHRRTTKPIYLGTNALVGLYTRTSPPARAMRQALLALGNRIGPARRLIMGRLTESGKRSKAA